MEISGELQTRMLEGCHLEETVPALLVLAKTILTGDGEGRQKLTK